MKLTFKYLIFFCCYSILNGQAINRDEGRIYTGANFNFYEHIKISNSLLNAEEDKTINYNDIQGSAYIDNELPIGKIYDSNFDLIKTVLVRYNAYADQMEVSLDEDGVDYYLVKKLPDFLYFVLNKKTYRAYEYSTHLGKTINYFVVLSENDQNRATLLKRETVIFKKEEKPQSSFVTTVPPRFIRTKDELFIKINEQILEAPRKKKDLYTLFPDRIVEMKDFIDLKNIKPTTEEDLIELVNYYNSLFN